MINRVFQIGRAQYGAGASLGPRDTVGYEFVRILKGEVLWHYNGEVYPLKPGSWLLSQPNGRETFHWDQKGQTIHDHIHFTFTQLPSDLPIPSTWPVTMHLPQENVLQSLFEHIVQLHQSDHPQQEMLLKNTVQHMLYTWAHQAMEFAPQKLDSFPRPVQRVVDQTQKRWNQAQFKPLSLTEMVKVSCVSRSSFLRLFQQTFQCTPGQFFEAQRLTFAQVLLRQTNRSTEQIAEYLDYSSAFHFSKNFKKLFDQAPSYYRKDQDLAEHKHHTFVFQKVFNLLSATQVL